MQINYCTIFIRTNANNYDSCKRQSEHLSKLAITRGYTILPENIYTGSLSKAKNLEGDGLEKMENDLRLTKHYIKMVYIFEISQLSCTPAGIRKLLDKIFRGWNINIRSKFSGDNLTSKWRFKSDL